MKLKCQYNKTRNCTLTGCTTCQHAPKNLQWRATHQRLNKREFQNLADQVDLIQQVREKEEFNRLRKICPTIQPIRNINEAVMECLICNREYCKTTDNQTELK